jgi:hypothetical protein
MAGSDGGGAMLAEISGAPLGADSLVAVVPAAIVGLGGSVGRGAGVGQGVKVGHGVGVGQGVGVRVGVGTLAWAKLLAVSRRATRSQTTTKLIKLKATIVALSPLPILAPRLR